MWLDLMDIRYMIYQGGGGGIPHDESNASENPRAVDLSALVAVSIRFSRVQYSLEQSSVRQSSINTGRQTGKAARLKRYLPDGEHRTNTRRRRFKRSLVMHEP